MAVLDRPGHHRGDRRALAPRLDLLVLNPLRIGAATVDRVEEQQVAIPLAILTDDDDLLERRITPLPLGFHDPTARTFQFSFHNWIIRVDGLTVLVDPCNGNGRTGRPAPMFDGLDTPYLERLAAVEAPAEAVDAVFCTHLHYDHCGWNTRQVDGRWVPTFPNARYVFVDVEYARWDTSGPGHPNDFNGNVFDESVRPVVEAGQATIVSTPHQLSSSLTVDPTPGHTVGHAALHLRSAGVSAWFVGDVVHHPVQVFRPELHLPGCDDLAQAVATRRTMFGRIRDDRALMFPAHFAEPHHGRVERADTDDVEFVFLPGGAPAK
jgi:glyoxylase-like metal-dependent hydrolase (beta-lactamase superfamily II)